MDEDKGAKEVSENRVILFLIVLYAATIGLMLAKM